MKTLAASLSILLMALFLFFLYSWGDHPPEANPYALQSGDIVFQGTAGHQAEAIREATDSPYTHCGVVFLEDEHLMVLEAVQPVRVTPLEHFLARSAPGTFHARRLKTAPSQYALERVWKWGRNLTGRNYDSLFRWDDETLYCSELVWKVFKQADIELCPRRHFRDYHLERPAVKKIIHSRYGGVDKLPADEWVVAPADIAASELLMEVPRRRISP